MERKLELLKKCEICPHNCRIDRTNGNIGICKSKDTVKIANFSLHKYEEPCISGKTGSGAVFFSNCNLKCVFCQNYEISQLGIGKEFTIDKLAQIFIKLQEKKANNINLVSPTSYAVQIIEAIKIAKKKGLEIPIIYNSNGYENIETIKLLNGYIDVYLPDFKYADNKIAKKYSKIDNYFEVVTSAIREMYNQVGGVSLDTKGMIKKGVIVRHLVLPNYIENSKNILNWINENLPEDIFISIMAQYFPTYKAIEEIKLCRKINREEYKRILKYLDKLNIKNGYIQQMGFDEKKYVPDWNFYL